MHPGSSIVLVPLEHVSDKRGRLLFLGILFQCEYTAEIGQ